MSFASDVKKEMTQNIPGKDCCRTSFMYGLLICGRSFGITLTGHTTENRYVAGAYCDAVSALCGHKAEVSVTAHGSYSVKMTDQADTIKILESFGHTGTELCRRVNRAVFSCDSCFDAFLAGAFLSCGTVTDPSKDYHLEFSTAHRMLASDIALILGESGFSPKQVRRNSSYVIYFKDSESIEDLLVRTGASKASLSLMGEKMYKDMRNHVNRQVNFENANLGKTAKAAAEEIKAIKNIEEKKGLSILPDTLRSVALIRLANPDYSLARIGQELDPPISRSGAYHRMMKIIDISSQL
jgi:DNA-binding protein WhiA